MNCTVRSGKTRAPQQAVHNGKNNNNNNNNNDHVDIMQNEILKSSQPSVASKIKPLGYTLALITFPLYVCSECCIKAISVKV